MAVFVDLEGTILQFASHTLMASHDGPRTYPLAAEGIRLMNDLALTVIVTGGYYGTDIPGGASYGTNDRVPAMRGLLLAEAGAEVDDILIPPPIAPEGLKGIAAWRYPDIDLAASIVVADDAEAVLMARDNGMRSILVRTGLGDEALAALHARGIAPDFIAEDLYAASHIISQLVDE